MNKFFFCNISCQSKNIHIYINIICIYICISYNNAQFIPGNKCVKATIKIPKLPANFTGTGDLFAALLTAWMYKSNNDIKEALEKTVATLHSVLKVTYKYTETHGISPKNLELKLVQCKSLIENPQVEIYAELVG